ncbi:DNA repair protein RecO [Mycoplasma sp. 744]|uniref:DNA repair protein RecO n=1 Tax=Mycoplasma sp. 744 TaxID=3108531 RepID=UPI002B1E77AF|nr:DNA repair protein RecO [Mycoplasma sp. 744]MEA4115283.1 DNA repair protein RecO [Mycoplasma sp. 744]
MNNVITQEVILLEINDLSANENDCIIKVMSENGIFNLLAKGINKAHSKNRANLLIGQLINIEYFPSRYFHSLSKLKKATLLTTLDYKRNDLLEFIIKISNFLNAFTFNKTTKIFFEYKNIINHISQLSSTELNFVKTYLLMQGLSDLGIEPIFNGCHICSSREKISNFDFYNGGFECYKHNQNVFLSSKILELIYYCKFNYDKYIKLVSIEIDTFIYQHLLTHYERHGIYLSWDQKVKIKI